MKKLLIIIIILALLSGIGYIVWTYFSSEDGKLPPNGGGAAPPPPGSVILPSQFSALSLNPAFDYWMATSGEIVYFAEDGQIFKINSAGSEEKISDQKLAGLNSLQFSKDGKYAAGSLGRANSVAFSVFNFEEKNWSPLPDGITSAAWDPAKNRLAYLRSNLKDSALYLIDYETKDKKPKTSELIRLNQKDIELGWFLADEIYLFDKPSAGITGSLLSLNLKTKALKPLALNEAGLMTKWSADGKLGLKFSANQLSLIDQTGRVLGEKIPFTTIPSKCAFDNTNLYCAVPTEIPEKTILPDDYLKKKFYSADSFFRWDQKSGVLNTIYPGGGTVIDAEKLKVHDGKLYFVNRYDKKIYSLKLGE